MLLFYDITNNEKFYPYFYSKQKLGYTQIHGKQRDTADSGHLALPWKDGHPPTERYLFKDQDIIASKKAEDSSKVPILKNDITSQTRKSPPLMPHTRREIHTPDDDEQGPERKITFLSRSVNHRHSSEYPGSYSNQLPKKPRTLKEALETVHNRFGFFLLF